MFPTTFLIVVASFFVLVWLLQIGATWWSLMRGRFYPERPVLSSDDDPPAELRELFEAVHSVLTEQAFAYSHTLHRTGLLTGMKECVRVYLHAETNSFALAAARNSTLNPRPYEIIYSSYLSDGRVVRTTDWLADIDIDDDKSVILNDNFSGNLGAQWDLHRRALAEVLKSPGMAVRSLTPQEHADLEAESFEKSHTRLQSKYLKTDEENYSTYRPVAALRLALKLLPASKHRLKVKNLTLVPPVETKVFIEADARLFEMLLNERENPLLRRWKLRLFTATVVVSAVAFGLLYSWQSVPLILIVLFLHELGHWAGMKAFGYRNPSIFFVPLFGAVTVGENEKASVRQRLIVYLLGPVPGIVLGIAALWFSAITGSLFWNTVGLMFLAINYFNLLPLTPFDGGKIVELLIGCRSPRGHMAFIGISVGVLLISAVLLHTPILFALCIILILTMRTTWRTDNVQKVFMAGIDRTMDQKSLRRSIVEFAYLSPSAKKTKGTRLGLARLIYARALSPLPTRTEVVRGLALFSASLGLPFIALIAYGILSFMRPAHTSISAWEKNLRDAATPAERRTILFEAAELNLYEYEEPRQAYSLYRLALMVSDSLNCSDDTTVIILRGLTRLEQHPASQKRYGLRALAAAEAIHGPTSAAAADVQCQIATLGTPLVPEREKISRLSTSISIYDSVGETYKAADTRRILALCLYNRGDADRCEKLLLRSIESLDTAHIPIYEALPGIHFLAELYSQSRRPSKAYDILRDWEEKARDSTRSGSLYASLIVSSHFGWIALREKDTTLAYEVISAAADSAKSLARKTNSGYTAVESVLDLCRIELLRGREDDARTQYDWIRKNLDPKYLQRRLNESSTEADADNPDPGVAWEGARRRANTATLRHFMNHERSPQ